MIRLTEQLGIPVPPIILQIMEQTELLIMEAVIIALTWQLIGALMKEHTGQDTTSLIITLISLPTTVGIIALMK